MRKLYVVLLSLLTLFAVGCSSSTKVRVKKTANKVATKVDKTIKKITSTDNSSSTNSTNSSTGSTEVLEATSKITVTNELILEYISKFKKIAQDNMKSHKVPASITMAQGILESGSGTGTLAVKANNHFGIKCHTGWTGESVRHDDDAPQECFRKYTDPAESYKDHSLFLTSRSRYNNLFKLDIKDYKAWAQGLKDAGYATDPKYPDKLISLIERYKLYELDGSSTPVSSSVSSSSTTQNNPNTTTVSNSSSIKSSGTYQVIAGDTLYSISRKFNISVQDIRTLNNLTTDAISVGQILKI